MPLNKETRAKTLYTCKNKEVQMTNNYCCKEIDSVNKVQILGKTIYISFQANASGKGMNTYLLLPAMAM